MADGAESVLRGRSLRLGALLGASVVVDLRIDLGDIEVDGLVVGGWGVTGREVGGHALADLAVAAALAPERRRGHASGLLGRMRRQPVFVRRIPSVPAGPSTSPGAGSR